MELKLRVFKDGKMYGHTEAVRLLYRKEILLEQTGFTILQFTGMKDKNGKEIYEGDILAEDTYRFEVIWSEYLNKGDLDLDVFIVGFVIRWSDGAISPFAYSKEMKYEVIGNIYENPELLK